MQRTTLSLLSQACRAASLESGTCCSCAAGISATRSALLPSTSSATSATASTSFPTPSLFQARFAASRPDAARASAAAAGLGAGSQAAAAAAAAAGSAAGEPETPISFFARQGQILASMPLYPKLLGFAGALPFMSLTPSIVEAAGFAQHVDYLAQMQLVYGGSIVTFLGAVHWGLAMATQAGSSGGKALSALNERYVWSVVPSLAVVPALMMHPAQGSLAISVLLGICYLSDASYYRAGVLPRWYATLRGYLTTLAMLSMLSTTAYYFKKDVEKAKKKIAEDDARRAARAEERAAAAAASRPSLGELVAADGAAAGGKAVAKR